LLEVKVGSGRAALHANPTTRLEAALVGVSDQGKLGKTIRCALSRWEAFRNIFRNGLAYIDNSATERAMWSISLGYENWTFAGPETDGVRAVPIYSSVEMAKLLGLVPEAYYR